jgi:hypothetical protein
VYDDDVVSRDSVGSAKIDLKKHVFGKGRYNEWVTLPAMLGLRSKGEIHVIIEHRVITSSLFFSSTFKCLFCFLAMKHIIVERTSFI